MGEGLGTSTYLSEGALGPEELVEDTDGDAEHGGQSQAPAQHLTPPRVHVHVVVGQRLVVHQVEEEDALRKTGSRRGVKQEEAVGLDRKWPWGQTGSGRRVGQDERWGWTGSGLGVRQIGHGLGSDRKWSWVQTGSGRWV